MLTLEEIRANKQLKNDSIWVLFFSYVIKGIVKFNKTKRLPTKYGFEMLDFLQIYVHALKLKS